VRSLHLDTFSGISGNMLLGALLDLGLPRKALERELSGLGLEWSLRVSRVRRGALAARYVSVRPGAGAGARRATRGRHGHAHGRHYREIRRLLERARMAEPVRARALAVFEALARAEAKVHGTRIEEVHFHEVGAVDAVVDVCGAAAGLHLLDVERVTASPVALGHGRVETEHGWLPLPAPATLELLRGVPCVPAEVAWETVTPTGAAILRTVVDEFCPLPAHTPEAVGHGAGDDREGALPNVLRAVLGRSGPGGRDRVVMLETNLDDLVPEHFDYLMERLFEAGALDVTLLHQQMKKNRPGFLVRVLAHPSGRLSLARILFAESTTLGVRTQEWDRVLLERSSKRVDTPFGRVRVKVVHGELGTEVSAEVDDCRRAARRHGVPLREVVRRVEETARSQLT